MNREYSRQIIEKLLAWGVAEFYVCAGARNFPLVETVLNIESPKKIVFNHFEERSAAFYALGRIKALKKPVAVITTSGTAAAELLPAVMEAYYSGLPLVVVTADRPRSYRGTGAPQAAEQKNLFGLYVSECFDLENGDDLKHFSSCLMDPAIKPRDDTPLSSRGVAVSSRGLIAGSIPPNKPLHLNICFDMPLQSGVLKPIVLSRRGILAPEVKLRSNSCLSLLPRGILDPAVKPRGDTALETFLSRASNVIVIVSKICLENKAPLIQFLKKLNCPVYLESISNLRECEELKHLRIHCADKIWMNAKKSNDVIDSVIKIGGTPTHRFWRDLDETQKQIKVFSIHHLPFPGMPNAEHITTDLEQFFKSSIKLKLKKIKNKSMESFLLSDSKSFKILNQLIKKYPKSEQAFFYHLSHKINQNSRVYLGNSLPIRYWDLAASYKQQNFLVEASRGVNGIDGQISTFLGFACESEENWGIFGDLTTLYDLAGPWMLQHRPNLKANIVIINNSGGKIFSKVLQGKDGEFCQNNHNLQFQNFAKMWNLTYKKITSVTELKNLSVSGQNVLEIVPNFQQTTCFEENLRSI